MRINDISKPLTANALNESLAKKFGQRIDVDRFTLEQLQDARNKVRTKLSQVETTESFNQVHSETYQKSKMFLDVLNAAISEREIVEKKVSEKITKSMSAGDVIKDFQDSDDPKFKGKSKEERKKMALGAYYDMHPEKAKKESIVREGAEDAAELVMAAKGMVDKVTGWMEDTAEMQTESMLELADAIRDEMGSEQSEAFVASVKPSLESLYTAMETTRDTLTQGVGMLTGEAEPADTMGAEEEPDMEPTVDAEVGAEVPAEEPAGDEFAAAEPAVGGEEEAGRAKRESIERSRRVANILTSKKK